MSKFTVNSNATGIIGDVAIEKADLLRAEAVGISYRMRVPTTQFSFDKEEDRAVVVPKDESGREASVLFVDLDRDLCDALVAADLKICGTATAMFSVDEVKNPAGGTTLFLRCRATPDSVVDLSEASILEIARKRSERVAAAKARKAAAEAAGDAAAPAAN